MSDPNERYTRAIQRLDAANSQDPRKVSIDGTEQPQEFVYAQRMSRWLSKLYPEASEALRLAARAHHLRRWTIPRNTYPMDRAGYHLWRTDLQKFHASAAGEILSKSGYDAETIARVQSLIRKEGLTTDPEAQALEDAICMVFLEHEFSDFLRKHPEEKLFTILRRTWAKMSPRGHDAAMELAPALPADAQTILRKALTS
jgi:hypothetical protein